jgi:hypothetical protein
VERSYCRREREEQLGVAVIIALGPKGPEVASKCGGEGREEALDFAPAHVYGVAVAASSSSEGVGGEGLLVAEVASSGCRGDTGGGSVTCSGEDGAASTSGGRGGGRDRGGDNDAASALYRGLGA